MSTKKQERLRDSTQPYDDTWFIIANNNYSYRFKSKKEALESSRPGRFYICNSYAYHTFGALDQRFNFGSFSVFDKEFTPTTIKVAGFECVKISEEEWMPGNAGATRIGFSIADQSGRKRRVWFSYGIKAIVKCIEFMQRELAQFNSWLEYDLHYLKEEVRELREENQLLKSELKKFHDSRDSIKKLYQLLFTEASEENQ